MNTGAIGPEFPRLLRKAWALSDPSTRRERPCDALDRPTMQQKFHTLNGDYWICSETGQMTREHQVADVFQLDLYEASWQRRIDAGQTHLDNRRHGHARWLGRLAPYRQTGRLFEVGAGLGGFLQAAVQAGWKAEGNELSSVASGHANRQAGVRVISGPMERVTLEPRVYDVVLCNNVFEHLSQPRRVLNHLAASLRPGGVIYFQTLNAQSLSLWFEPRGWLYFAKGHLYAPTLVSLRHYFQGAGLRVMRRETHGFRWVARGEGSRRPQRTAGEKLMSILAARLGRGHRVKCMLQRPA